MVQSKREKVISLTTVKKKDKKRKSEIISNVQSALHKFAFTVVYEVENEKSAHMQYIRAALKPSSMFYGGNKLIKKALNDYEDPSLVEAISDIGSCLVGRRGLIFTNEPISFIEKIFQDYQPNEAAKSGFVPTETVILQEGPEALAQFPHSMEPQLRKLGLPTVLKSGSIYLMGDTTVCTEGLPLTAEAAQLLNLLGYRMAKFRVHLVAALDKEKKTVQHLQ